MVLVPTPGSEVSPEQAQLETVVRVAEAQLESIEVKLERHRPVEINP